MTDRKHIALVLSGGGVRGAYEAGVISAIVDILGRRSSDPAPFDIFAGTSVGAINATFFAANGHRGDLGVRELERVWTRLRLRTHLRFDPAGFLGLKPRFQSLLSFDNGRTHTLGRSLLDPRPLEAIIRHAIPWKNLHRNLRDDRVHALIVPALHIGTGRTTIFAELSPKASLRPSRRPRRHAIIEPITADHVLASAALPLLFPARRIGRSYYADGGLRFNTPIAPAIRAGADKLVVVSLLYEEPLEQLVNPLETTSGEDLYPSPTFLAGKVLNALILDPVKYDLQLLERINTLMSAFEENLDDATLERIRSVIEDTRGMGYRKIDTLVFSPTENIGAIAAEHVRENIPRWKLGRLTEWILETFSGARAGNSKEADFSSYLLFDGGFARKLIELGYRDTQARAEEIIAFYQN